MPRMRDSLLALTFTLTTPTSVLAAPPDEAPPPESPEPAPVAEAPVDPQVQPWTLPQPVADPNAPTDPTAAPAIEPAATAAEPPVPTYQPESQPGPAPAPSRTRKLGLGLAIGGFASFSAVYIVNVAIAATAESGSDAKWLAIPIAGPFATLSQLRFVEHDPDAIIDAAPISNTFIAIGGVFLVIDGLAQIATLSMGIAGATLIAKSNADARLTLAPGGLRLKF